MTSRRGVLRFAAGGVAALASAQGAWLLGRSPAAGVAEPLAVSSLPPDLGLIDGLGPEHARSRIIVPGLSDSGIAPPPPPPAVDSRYDAPASFQRGDSSVKVAYLTMDDCWSTVSVTTAMDVVEGYGAKLTFFPYGGVMSKSPDLWREIRGRGHGIENHTLSHKTLPPLTDEALYDEMQGWNRVARDVLDKAYAAAFFRPPSGAGVLGKKDERIFKIAAQLGMKIAMWSSDSQGWRYQSATDSTTVAAVTRNALYAFGPGSIVLQHAVACDVLALPSILEEAKRQGLTCKTLREGIR